MKVKGKIYQEHDAFWAQIILVLPNVESSGQERWSFVGPLKLKKELARSAAKRLATKLNLEIEWSEE
jgi:hypothetical protein